MKQGMTGKERALQIELLRARAILERQAMVRAACDVTDSLTPRSIWRSFFPRASSRSPSDWLIKGLALTRRYPLLTSGVSALLSGVGKRRRWWRMGAGLLLSWHVARVMNRKAD